MATSDFLIDEPRDMSPKSMAHRWINYKQMFLVMYGKHIYHHYRGNIEAVAVLKYEILYL